MRNYIEDSFHPDDRLAVMCKDGGRVRQRIVTARELASTRIMAWLAVENRRGADVYVGMNPLKPEARGRTKQDIATVRHVYLDIDHDGDGALARIKEDSRLPAPSHVLNTSPGKYQVVWKVAGFAPDDAERLQKAMAAAYGADRAATDVTRVLRIPGFLNRKYDPPCPVTAEKVSGRVRLPSDFKIWREPAHVPPAHGGGVSGGTPGGSSQSERDWAETCRRIERGDHPAAVAGWLERNRPDKPNPRYYAELTVRKALMRCTGNTASRDSSGNSL